MVISFVDIITIYAKYETLSSPPQTTEKPRYYAAFSAIPDLHGGGEPTLQIRPFGSSQRHYLLFIKR
jgi:hypothetical protein